MINEGWKPKIVSLDRAKKRIQKEFSMRDTLKQGYSRRTSSRWYNAQKRDNRLYREKYPQEVLDKVHAEGFLAKNIERLDLLAKPSTRISDLDYMSLWPINNSFSKWIDDINTMTRILPEYSSHFPKIYYSIVNRNCLKVLEYPVATKRCRVRDILNTVRDCGKTVILRPAFWESKGASYALSYQDEQHILVDGKPYTMEAFYAFLRTLGYNYLICEQIHYGYRLTKDWNHCAFYKFYIANDMANGKILCALAEVLEENQEMGEQFLIDRQTGCFTMHGKAYEIPNWRQLVRELLDMANCMPQLTFFSVSVVLTRSGFMISQCNRWPYLPRIPFDREMDDYLKGLAAEKRAVVVPELQKITAIKDSLFARFVGKYCRPGIRPYMERLWLNALKSDAVYDGTTIPEKLWAWRHGFLSYRIKQYGLTKENYQEFLSDYDYMWLNRMNNVYQVWVNDKTTFRYIMEPMKEFIPSYYFSVFKKNGTVVFAPMQDLPQNIDRNIGGLFALLRDQKILAFKPSAGTHGDGFYCLEYRDGRYWVNGEASSDRQIETLVQNQKSFYIVTSYIEMHPQLKAIYPKSVNSIRMMLINRHGYDPKIMQTYMRIGSSQTGYTDNVGYGGIAAMIDTETGRIYNSETIKDHVFYPCPTHPDTGVAINGIVVPHWDMICEKVKEICKLMPELEYLGFDVAVTEDGFNVMEINIHQDLHKVALHSDEIREYFQEWIRYKKCLVGLS